MTQEATKFCDKLIQLRREKGYSQEQLADYLNVSRQAVSKWEANQSTPALEKLIQMSDLFGVSVDYLVRENVATEERNKTVVTTLDDSAVMEQLDQLKTMVKDSTIFDYKSKRTLFGLPLIHIRYSRTGRPTLAKGIIAIGTVAIGLISFGAVSAGLISFGALTLGLLLAVGAISVGGIALGALAIGVFAMGACAIGVFAFGASATASCIGAGAAASGRIAFGEEARGEFAYHWDEISRVDAQQLIHSVYPKLPEFLVRLFTCGIH